MQRDRRQWNPSLLGFSLTPNLSLTVETCSCVSSVRFYADHLMLFPSPFKLQLIKVTLQNLACCTPCAFTFIFCFICVSTAQIGTNEDRATAFTSHLIQRCAMRRMSYRHLAALHISGTLLLFYRLLKLRATARSATCI